MTDADLTQDWPEYASPGQEAVASADAVTASTEREALNLQADTAWRDAGLEDPGYDHRAAFASGKTNLKDQPLPNEFIKAHSAHVAGYEMTTGRRVTAPIKDRDGLALAGLEDLKKSSTLRKFGKVPESPPIDAAGMAKVATAYLREGKTFDDFKSGFTTPYSDKHFKVSWDAAVNSENTRALSYLLATDRGMVQGPVPTQNMQVLHADDIYAQKALKIYHSYKGEPFAGTNIEAAKWLTEHIRDFSLNTPMAALIWSRAINGSTDLKASYLYAFNAYDKTDIDWSLLNVSANVSRMLADPSNLVGFGVGKATVMTASRAAFKGFLARAHLVQEGLKDFGKRGAVGAAIGAPLGATKALQTADLTGQDPVGSTILMAGVEGAAWAGGLNAGLPELAVAGGQLIRNAGRNLEKWEYKRPGGMQAQRGEILPGQRAQDPETGVGSPVVWRFEAAAGVKQDKGQAIARAKGAGITKEQADQAVPVIEDLYSDGKPHTGAEIAEKLDEAFNPPRVQWITPHPPGKRFSKTKINKFIDAQDPIIEIDSNIRGLVAARRDFLDRIADGEVIPDEAAQRIQLNQALNNARKKREEIVEDLVAPEERRAGYMFSPGVRSDFPRGKRITEILKENPEWQELVKERDALLKEPMHWDRQAKVSQVNYAMDRLKASLFTREEMRDGRAWGEGVPRTQAPAPRGPTLEEHFADHPDYAEFVARESEARTEIRQSEEWIAAELERGGSVAHEQARLDGFREDLQRAQESKDLFLRENLEPIEYEQRQIYAPEQRQGRLRVASNIAHLQSVGTPDRYGLKPESGFMWLELGDPRSKRRGYEGHVGNERGTIGWAPVTIHKMDDGGNALAAHELQSDHQKNLNEARWNWAKVKRELPNEDRSYEQLRWDNYRDWKWRQDLTRPNDDGLSSDWLETTAKERDDMVKSRFFEQNRMIGHNYNATPQMQSVFNEYPMMYERTFMLNLMKAALRKAAQEGMDAVAFPSQAHIAERWSSAGVPVRAKQIKIMSSGAVMPVHPEGGGYSEVNRFEKQFFRAKTEETGRLAVAKMLDDQGEKDAAKALREWKEGDGPMNLQLTKKIEMVPMGFLGYREAMRDFQKFIKSEFGLEVQDIKGEYLKPALHKDLEGKPIVEHFRGPKLTPEKREEIMKKGINMSKLESQYALA